MKTKLFLIISLISTSLFGVEFAPLFNNGAILQCEMPVNVWGRAAAGETVALFLNGKKLTETIAGADGKWLAVLPAQAAGGAHILEAAAGGESVKISDVWFGEVWLASGQSNMVMPLQTTFGGPERLAMTIPEIRFVRVPLTTGLPVEKEFTVADLAWMEFSPPNNKKIAATAFYFAEQIQQHTGRRVGIIQSAYGGTPGEAWTPLTALDAHPQLNYMAEQIREGLAAGKSKAEWEEVVAVARQRAVALAEWRRTGEGAHPGNPIPVDLRNPWSSRTPTVLYENMIVPLIPVTTRGVIWSQGEGNTDRPQEYGILFPAMIEAWRAAWARPDWPFLFVQIGAYTDAKAGGGPRDWPGLRAAQTMTRDTVPNTGMALAIDIGDKDDPHARAKQPVGDRFGRLARNQVYGQNVVSRGPCFESAAVQPDGNVIIRFSHVDEKLITAGGAPVTAFEVAGADGVFHPAAAEITGADSVTLSCAAVPAPAAVRYAWANWIEPVVTLQNSEGLPAEPFSWSNDKL